MADGVAWWCAGILAVVVAGSLAYARRQAGRMRSPARLDDRQRAQLVADVKAWLRTPAAVENER